MGEVYVHYPTLENSPHDRHSPQVSDDSQSLPSYQSNAQGAKLRRHAACDECRKRKLKCTGEPEGCTRCVKNSIPCIYSQQKQMGRPRKRQRTDDGTASPPHNETTYIHSLPPQLPQQAQSRVEVQVEPPIDPSLANIDHELTSFHNVCNAPLAQTIRSQRETGTFRNSSIQSDLSIFDQNSDTASQDYPYTRYPTDISQWPDFSTTDKLPLPLIVGFETNNLTNLSYTEQSAPSTTSVDTAQPHFDPDVDPAALSALPSIPSCPCLPNLYLSLSTLSTLSNFPVSQQTVDTLLAAHKTAHAVIYCPVCPQKYQSGSQNLMLGCTLLNVLADHWHRIRNAAPDVLKKGFSVQPVQHYHLDPALNGTPPTQPAIYVTVKEGQTWRAFSHQLVRAYVFGDASIPKPPSPNPPSTSQLPSPKVSESNTLYYLVSALERRQRQWHRLDPLTDEFPDRGTHDLHKIHGGPGYGPNIGPAESHRLRHKPTGEHRDHMNHSKSRPRSKTGGANGNSNSNVDAHDADGESSVNGDHVHCSDTEQDDHDGERHPMVCLALVRHTKNILAALGT